MRKILSLITLFLVLQIITTFTMTSATDKKLDEQNPQISRKELKQQYNKAMNDLSLLREMILDYIIDNKKAPEAENLEILLKQDVGNGLSFAEFYMNEIEEKDIPVNDPWGNRYKYIYKKDEFKLGSSGSDGKFKGFKQNGVYADTYKNLSEKDIIISHEGFVFFPVAKNQLLKQKKFFIIFWKWIRSLI